MSLFLFPLRFLFVYTNPTAYFKMKEIKESIHPTYHKKATTEMC